MPEGEDDFDKFVEKLQQEIIDKEIKAFNKYVVDLFHNPKNWGIPPNFTVSHSYKGPCNDTMEFFLTIKDGIIERANFFTDGCGATVATGSQTTDDHKHCLELTVRTLKSLIEKYKNNKV